MITDLYSGLNRTEQLWISEQNNFIRNPDPNGDFLSTVCKTKDKKFRVYVIPFQYLLNRLTRLKIVMDIYKMYVIIVLMLLNYQYE